MEALQIPNNQITIIDNWNNIDINFKWNTVALSLLLLNPFFHPTFFPTPDYLKQVFVPFTQICVLGEICPWTMCLIVLSPVHCMKFFK